MRLLQSPIYQDFDISSSLHLRDILTNPSSLSYFMEFMDRRGRSLLVQFWLTVESFKNPLEAVESDSSDEESESLSSRASPVTLKEDLNMINDLYFSGSIIPASLSCISQKHIENIRFFVHQPSTNPALEKRARRSVMLAQRQVEQDMDYDFDEFRRSDLWFRAVSDLNAKERTDNLPLAQPLSNQPSTQSSSGSLLSNIMHGITPDFIRPPFDQRPSFSGRSTSFPAALDSSAIAKPRPSLEDGRSSAPSSASPSRNVSGQNPFSSLEILMSPSIDADSGLTRAPLFDETEDGQLISADASEAQRMEAIQAAVTDIIATENKLYVRSGSEKRTSRSSLDQTIDSASAKNIEPKRRGIFDDASGDMVSLIDQDAEEDELKEGTFQLAAPGDLQLSGEISRLEDKIVHLQSQDMILDTLIRKAELTGDAQELRLLRRSKSALERELRQLTFQKTQYEQQDSLNKLIPGKTKASIVNATAAEEEGKQVVRYLIEVQQLGQGGSFASGWIVARRYSEFLVMHQRLKDRYLNVKSLEFPGKRLVTTLSSNLVDNRRVALEKYLQVMRLSYLPALRDI